MLLGHRFLLSCVLLLPIVSGCGSSSHGSESGTIAPTGTGTVTSTPMAPVTPPKATPIGTGKSGDNNDVVATASVDAVAVVVGASQTITVTFTSNDGQPISAFGVYGSLGTLPAGWSAPNSLTCGDVSPGSGCALTLTYAPTAVETGTLSLDCVFVDNAGLPRTPGPCLSLSYAGTASNNVVAHASPDGEIDAKAGSVKRAVSVNFSTDDGNAASAFTVTTDLAALPAGWSSKVAGLSCAVVSTGSGCQLPLQFAPTASASSTLSLAFTYIDASGAAKSGTLNVPYASSSHQLVVASVSPSGETTAAQAGGQQSVAVTFTTADGSTVSGLSVIAGLSKLPAGWSSGATTFGCDSVSTGNGCQLQLKFAPTALGLGTLTLRYSYTEASGAANFGLLNIPYAATTNDSVMGTVAPTGQIVAMLGSPSQAVAVTFTTDDSRLATALQVNNLSALPAGWSVAAPTFGCSALVSGTPCQLMLAYSPTGVDNGTLTLNYSYLNNANEAKSGTVAIDYRTTTNDNVIATAAPLLLAVTVGSSNPVMVTFNTDDGNVAYALAADLSTLPPDWSSGTPSLACAKVSTGSGCQVALNYAPSLAASGTLTFGYSYVNSAGTAKTGTVSVPYVAAP